MTCSSIFGDGNSMWVLHFVYIGHEFITIRLENAVRALQNVSHFVSQTNKELGAVLEMANNFQLMLWDCHHRCEFPRRTRCS